jgi:hypothetical protein
MLLPTVLLPVELTHVPPTTLSRSIQKALQYFEGKVLGPEDTAALIKQLCDAQQGGQQ